MQYLRYKPRPGAKIDFSHPLARGLVGCWLMNGQGWREWDYSPYQNNGTLTNFTDPVHTLGQRSSEGIHLDGIDDLINVANAASLKITGNITISVFVHADSFGVTPRGIVVKDDAGVGQGYGMYISATGEYQFTSRIGGAWSTVATGIKPVNTVFHITAVYDGITQMIYCNGNVEGSTPIAGAITDNDHPLILGDFVNGGIDNHFAGRIITANVYNRALTADEIKQLYLNPYSMFF